MLAVLQKECDTSYPYMDFIYYNMFDLLSYKKFSVTISVSDSYDTDEYNFREDVVINNDKYSESDVYKAIKIHDSIYPKWLHLYKWMVSANTLGCPDIFTKIMDHYFINYK